MGKQFRFIMDQNDETKFFDYIKETGNIFLEERFKSSELITKLPEGIWIILLLYKESFGEIKFSKTDNGIKYINPIIEPVIEFSQTLVRDNVKEISRGRLWLEMRYYNEDEMLVMKSELLDEWYKELSKWIKKNLKCIKVTMGNKTYKEYVSESLISKVESGYELLG